MDFSKFRASGDLSDMVVVVDDQENKLHKFPLYARSDYFCDLQKPRSGSGESEVVKVELENFPGGNEVFEIVADFCYNMPVSIDKHNAVAIRCASEYLQMSGSGNLVDISHRFIQDTVSAARLNRSSAAILSMLIDCNPFGETARDSGIVEMCVDALVDCLSKTMNNFIPISAGSSSFSKVTPKYKSEESSNLSAFTKLQTDSTTANSSQEMLDDVTVSGLVSIRSDWFSLILHKATEKGVAATKLGTLAVRYVSSAIEGDGLTGAVDDSLTRNASGGSKTDDDDAEKEKDTTVTTPSSVSKTFILPEKIDRVLDNVILSLSEHAYSIPSVTMEWLTKVLRIATARGCQCRGHLVRVAGEMLTRLEPEDLCIISPSVLHDIVQDANVFTATQPNDDESAQPTTATIHSERACKLVDTYLDQMTSKGVLTAETFLLLASATKDYPRLSHDSLFTVLEFVLDSEKDKLSPTQREELVSIINLDLISETNLQKALEGNIAPPAQVATSAVKLCSKLRSELDSVKYIAEMQEQDIQKYQTAASTSPSRHSPPLLKDPVHYRTYHYTSERSVQPDFGDILESGTKSPETAGNNHHESPEDYHEKSDALRAAQSVLTAARHKLALPVYTGYRPSHLTRLHSPSHSSHSSTRPAMEHDISLEEELEFKFDRSFRSLDPRVRNHRLLNVRENSHHSPSHHNAHHSSPRSYFPYSSSSYRY